MGLALQRNDISEDVEKIVERMLRLKKASHPLKEFLKKWGALRRELYKTGDYQCFLREVRTRAMYLCERGCGKKGRHVHHKIRVYDDPSKCVDCANAEFLCIGCHRKEHRKEEK